MELGIKNDRLDNKLRWDLLPISEVEKIVSVLTFGAKKYNDNNWMLLENGLDRYYAAAMRHLAAHRKGEINDPETGESHLAHAGACILFMLWIESNGVKEEHKR